MYVKQKYAMKTILRENFITNKGWERFYFVLKHKMLSGEDNFYTRAVIMVTSATGSVSCCIFSSIIVSLVSWRQNCDLSVDRYRQQCGKILNICSLSKHFENVYRSLLEFFGKTTFKRNFVNGERCTIHVDSLVFDEAKNCSRHKNMFFYNQIFQL